MTRKHKTVNKYSGLSTGKLSLALIENRLKAMTMPKEEAAKAQIEFMHNVNMKGKQRCVYL